MTEMFQLKLGFQKSLQVIALPNVIFSLLQYFLDGKESLTEK
jgi:hypothetical protein